MSTLYNTLIFQPLYNGLIFLIDKLPSVDIGIIIILFTILVRVIIFPISRKAARTQVMMKTLEPELKVIKEKYSNDKQAQARATMDFYKNNKINPFSSILLLFIQLPIIFALYRIFYQIGVSQVNGDLLYSFISAPSVIHTSFLGLVDVTQKSLVLAIIAALSQFLQIHISMPKPAPKTEKGGFQEDFARSMHLQMKYIFPLFILFIGYHAAGALAIYWTTSNLFMIAQELYIRRQIAREKASASIKA